MNLPFKVSVKHVQIDKANNLMFIIAAIAAVVTAFSLLSAKVLLSQSSFQHKVLKAKNQAVTQLKSNINSADTLRTHYDAFESGNPNIIGGQGGVGATNSIPPDGDNARVVLDALPSQYDFPALTSSLEKILDNDHVSVQGITGTDDSQNQSTTTSTPSQQSQPQSMSFSVDATTDYASSQNLIKDFERSIRPFDVTTLTLNGSSSSIAVSIQANTYYQPAVSLQIGQKGISQ